MKILAVRTFFCTHYFKTYTNAETNKDSSGPEYYTKLLFTAVRFDRNGYNRLYFAKPASKNIGCGSLLSDPHLCDIGELKAA